MIEMADSAVKRVRDYLSSNLAVTVSDFNAGRTEGAPSLSTPGHYGWAEYTTVPNLLPAILVVANHSIAKTDSPGQRMNVTHDLSVLIIDRDSDEATLRRRMYRWAAVIISCLHPQSARVTIGFSGWGNPIARYSPIYVNGNQYEADCQVSLSVYSQEEF